MSVELQYKANSGNVITIQVEEVLSVDGSPYGNPVDDMQDIKDTLIHFSAKIESLEYNFASLIANKET